MDDYTDFESISPIAPSAKSSHNLRNRLKLRNYTEITSSRSPTFNPARSRVPQAASITPQARRTGSIKHPGPRRSRTATTRQSRSTKITSMGNRMPTVWMDAQAGKISASSAGKVLRASSPTIRCRHVRATRAFLATSSPVPSTARRHGPSSIINHLLPAFRLSRARLEQGSFPGEAGSPLDVIRRQLPFQATEDGRRLLEVSEPAY